MKTLLEALKTEIQNGMDAVKQVAVIPDKDILPVAVRFPFVGLKDGPVARSEGANETVELTESVFIYIYVQLLKEEASIMGDGTNKGLLELYADLHALLEHNNLDLDGVEGAFCPEEFESEPAMMGENVFLQRKGCRYEYIREE